MTFFKNNDNWECLYLKNKDSRVNYFYFLIFQNMKTSLKKLVAGASIVALVAMNAVFTNAATPEWSITGNDLVITDSNFLASQDEAKLTVYVTDSSNATVAVTSVISDGILTLTTPWIASTVYSVRYIFNDWVTQFSGAVVIDNNNNFTVNVTATVLPILSMELSDNSLNFGELVAGTSNIAKESDNTTWYIEVTASTNARGGLKVYLSSLNAWLKDGAELIAYKWDLSATTEEGYRFITSDEVGLTDEYTDNSNFTANTAKLIASTTGPVDRWTIRVAAEAGITTTTAAWNYTDTLEYTITGTF